MATEIKNVASPHEKYTSILFRCYRYRICILRLIIDDFSFSSSKKMETKKLNAESKPSVTIDELYKIRVLDPDTASKTELLKAECKEFVKSK